MPITFSEYESFDGLGLANLVQSGVISPEELLEAAIERIELWNPHVNAVIHKMYDEARHHVKTNSVRGPFSGVPILLKDLLADCEGTPLRLGSRYTSHWISPHDSELVKRLKQSGIIVLGKTNVPEFGLSPITEPELFGPTRNPWDLSRSPGGSSGGSAAAVAARMVPIAHAGDGGGSIRMPASYCGVFGFKPSRGRTPTGPIFMRVWQGIVVEHVLSRSVRDSAAMLDVLSGPEIGSPFTLSKPVHSFLSSLEKPMEQLRIAYIDEPFFAAKVDSEYAIALKQAAQLCKDLGHVVEPASFKINRDEVGMAFLIIMAAETTTSIQLLAKEIGHKPTSKELEKPTAIVCHAGEEFTAADYAWATYVLDQAGKQLAEFYEKYDVILTPTLPFPAPKVGAFAPDRNEQVVMQLLRYLPYGKTLRQFLQQASERNFSFMSFTALFNIGGQPAMSVPLFWDTNNLPIGIQFAGKLGEDAQLFRLAKQLEDAHSWAQRKPEKTLTAMLLS